jgi:hypothetical protein
MSASDPVIDLDNAIATAYMLAAQIGAAPPLIHGRYELRRTLGRGAHGLVCEALDRHLQRSVALKLVPLRDSRSATSAAREAQTLAQFDHPNIVRIFDVGQTSDVSGLKVEIVYVVMELLKGVNLRHWAADRPGQREVLEVFLAAGEGLAAAHEQGFIHGDFKPENVVIDERRRVRVVDFGLARWGGDEVVPVGAFAVTRTMTQGPRGTPGYIAPEVFTAKGDARSDQYSFAVSLWELLLGRLPFERPGEASAPDLGRSAASLAAPLTGALQRGFASDPAARFPSMRELLAALRDSAESVDAPTMPPPSGRWRWPVVGGLFVSAGLLGALVLSGQFEPEAEVAAAQAVIPAALQPCPEVAAIAGTWDYTSAVMWAAEGRFLGERGYYRVTVTPETGCRATFHVEKHGDSSKPKYGENLEDQIVREVTRAADGAIEVMLDLKLAKPSKSSAGGQRSGLNYRQLLSWTNGSLRGDWSFIQAKTRAPEMRGLLIGRAAGQVEDDDFTLAQATCPGQCRVRCAGDTAASQCITQRCRGASGSVLDCGSADDTFEPPSNTLQVATEGLGSARGVTTRCRQVAQRLPGTWKIWKRPLSGSRREPELFEVKLESSGCAISGRVHPPSGVTHDIHGWVDPDSGVWRLQPTDRPAWPIWALAGWDPAFGAADGGKATLVAHKQPSP